MAMTTAQGYAFAARMGKILNEALQKYDIENSTNHDGYRSLLRTVETSLHICRKTVRVDVVS